MSDKSVGSGRLEQQTDSRKENSHLEETDIHNILSNRRRRLVIEHLAGNGEEMTLRELSEKIAEDHVEESPAPRDLRASVYSSLHQTHLPKLNEMGVVTYDQNSKVTKLDEGFDEVRLYTEIVTPYGITWSQYYILLGSLSLLTIMASEIGVPYVAKVGTLIWSGIFIGLIVLSALYQMMAGRGRLYREIHRITPW